MNVLHINTRQTFRPFFLLFSTSLIILLSIQPTECKNVNFETKDERFERYKKILGPGYHIENGIATKLSTREKFYVAEKFPDGVKDSHGHDPLHHALVVLVVLVVLLIAAQFALKLWKRHSPHSYQIVTLFALWLLPLFLQITPFYVLFVLLWSLFSFVTLLMFYKTTSIEFSGNSMRHIYIWFYCVYQISCYTALFGYLLLLIQLVNLHHFFGMSSLIIRGFTLIFYGLYFGVLGRDLAEVCTNRMALKLGYLVHSEDKHLPSIQIDPQTCPICKRKFVLTTNANRCFRILNVQRESKINLNCGHEFHDFCIRSWSMVGKKDICPLCREKVLRLFSNSFQTIRMLGVVA